MPQIVAKEDTGTSSHCSSKSDTLSFNFNVILVSRSDGGFSSQRGSGNAASQIAAGRIVRLRPGLRAFRCALGMPLEQAIEAV